MTERMRGWLATNPGRAGWTAMFLVVNLFFILNHTIGPFGHSMQTYALIGAAQLGTSALLHSFAGLETRLFDLAINAALVVLFVSLFGGLA